MKRIVFLLALLVCLPVQAQELNAHRLTDILEQALDKQTQWEMRVETDVNHKTVDSLPYKSILSLPFYITEETVRYRSRITIPPIRAGKRVAGGKAFLNFSLSGPADYRAEVFINGEKRIEYPTVDSTTRAMETTPLVLTENAVPGTEYEVVVLIHNPLIYPAQDYPLSSKTVGFGGAELELEQTEEAEEKLAAFLINVHSARMLVTPWKPNEKDERPFVPERENRSRFSELRPVKMRGIMNQAVAKFDLQALEAGDWQAVSASIDNVLSEMKPLEALAGEFTIYLVGNAHIDLAWLWRTNESVEIAANTWQSVLNNLAQFPEMTFAQSQAQAYKWVEEQRPELFQNIQQAEKTGSWDVVGGMWAEPDCNLIGGESWIRQILYAQTYFKEHFGETVSLGWNPDSFGYNWNMPQFYSKSGIKAFITQKISWNHQTRFPYHLFWWEAPDGSRILTYLPPGSYVEKVEYKKMLDQLLNFEHATGFREVLCLIGFGNHGGGPNVPMLERARMLAEQPYFPNVEFITAHEYLELLNKKDLSGLPVWKSEMYLENHRGTLTTQAETKRYNRLLEGLLNTSEKAFALAALRDRPYPTELLEETWKTVLLNQFHDILPGSSITPVFHDAEETYALAETRLRSELADAIRFLSPNRSTDPGSETLTVFNPATWQRSGIVKFQLPESVGNSFAVRDDHTGARLAATVETEAASGTRYLLFEAPNLEPLELRQFTVTPAPAPEVSVEMPSGYFMENAYLKVSINPETGNISSIYDKGLAREILAAGEEGNVIELHENLPSFWDAWNIGYTGRQWRLDSADDIELIENNDLRQVIRVKKSFLGLSKANMAPTEGFPSSFFVQDIILYRNSPMLIVEMDIDWWEDHTLLKVSFPLAVEADTATYEIPYAAIERSTRRETLWEKARYEVSVHRWADMSQDDWGVSLLNDSKYGMDTHDNVMRLTLLTSPLWPDPLADRGRQRTTYAIYPHAGDWRAAGTVRLAEEFNNRMPAVMTSLQQPFASVGTGRSQASLVSEPLVRLDSQQAMISTIKNSHDGESVIIRVVELHGTPMKADLIVNAQVLEAVETDLMENPTGKLTVSAGVLPVELGAYEIKTISLKLAATTAERVE